MTKRRDPFAHITQKMVDVFPPTHDGYVDEKGEDRSDNFAGMEDADGNVVSYEFPERLWIDPKDWRDVASDNTKYRLWPQMAREDFGRFTNQSPTSECTAHSLVQGAEAAYRNQLGICTRNGRKGNILLAPMSIYGRTNPSGRGGANCLNVMKTAVQYGFLPEPGRGQDQIFDHTLIGTRGRGNSEQKGGVFTPARRFPQGSESTSVSLRPIEVIIPRTIEQCICLILHRYVNNVGRNGHAVPHDILVWKTPGDWPDLFGYSDSYDRVLYDSLRTAKRCVSGASAITLMTTCETFEDAFYAGNI